MAGAAGRGSKGPGKGRSPGKKASAPKKKPAAAKKPRRKTGGDGTGPGPAKKK